MATSVLAVEIGFPTPPGRIHPTAGHWYRDARQRSAKSLMELPNREVCVGDVLGGGQPTASSRHQGGCHVVMADGAVKFLTDSIEAGNSNAGTVHDGGTGTRAPGSMSPYGLWGALGTRANKEANNKANNKAIDQEIQFRERGPRSS